MNFVMRTVTVASLAVVAGVATVGCTHEVVGEPNGSDPSTGDYVPGDQVDPHVVGLPIADLDGVTVIYRGTATFDARSPGEGLIADATGDSDAEDDASPLSGRFIATNAKTGEMYEVDLGPLAGSFPITKANPGTMAAFGEDAHDDVVQKTWSNGTDTRILRGNSDGWNDNSWPYRTIGALWGDGGCTAQFVGYRLLLTAAHCLMRSRANGNAAWTELPNANTFNLTFGARIDRNTISPTWGTETPSWYWVPVEYNDGTCNTENACNRYDIGLIFLDQPSGAHPGWMGHWYGSQAHMNAATKYMRGYPGCGAGGDTGASRPGGQSQASHTCQTRTLYGHTSTCATGTARNNLREYLIDCDGSPGMSGSAIYATNPGSTDFGTCALGVYSQYLCVGPACTTRWVNRMTTVTQEISNIINLFNAFYPAPW